MLLFLAVLAVDGEILAARFEAAVSEGPDVAVRLAYRVEPSLAASVSFSALEIEGVAIEEIAAFASDSPLAVDLEPRSGPKREGTIDLPPGTETLELRYVVRRGAEWTDDGVRVRLPCAILDRKLEETRSGLFSSVVSLPAGLSIVDGFPAHSIAAADGTHRWELPVVPAFLSLRASSKAVLFTPSRVATLAVGALIALAGIVGRPSSAVLSTMTEEGIVFWGPFAAFAVISVLYVLWMWWVERGE